MILDKETEAKPAEEDNDAFEKLLATLGEGGGESEEELQGLLETMMTQLMSKDVLYEPLKELHEKFPPYLKDNAATLKPEDKQRYEAQQKIVAEIITMFEDSSYTPEDQEKGIKIVTLMNTVSHQYLSLRLAHIYSSRCKLTDRLHRKLWVHFPQGSNWAPMVCPSFRKAAAFNEFIRPYHQSSCFRRTCRSVFRVFYLVEAS